MDQAMGNTSGSQKEFAAVREPHQEANEDLTFQNVWLPRLHHVPRAAEFNQRRSANLS